MPTEFESEISSLISEQSSLVGVADELIARLHRNILNEGEQSDAMQFLIATGHFSRFFAEISRLVDIGGKIPWAQFAEAIGQIGVKLDEFDLQAILESAESQGAIADLVRSRRLDSLHRGFKERRISLALIRERELKERKQGIKDKLAYLRANRMLEEEAKVLDELQSFFPEESDLAAERESLQVRLAREVVARSVASRDPTAEFENRTQRLPPEQVAAKNLIVDRARELARDNPRLAYDLAMNLHMMDFNSEAIQILNFSLNSYAADWFRLELMVRSREFVSALDEANRLEMMYAHDPEAAFAAAYARARALKGLGQTASAVELLSGLVRIRPHYKSAQSLLTEWTGGEA